METKTAALRLAIQRLNEVTDLLTPHAAEDRLVYAVAELAGVGASVLVNRIDIPDELVKAAQERALRVVADPPPVVADPPFDASEYERPGHHVSCLCADCCDSRGVAGVVR